MVLRRYALALAPLMLLLMSASCVKQKSAEPPVKVHQVTPENFNAAVLNHQGPVLILFYDEGEESLDMHRRYINLAEKYWENVKFCRMKWEEGMDMTPFKLESLPTVLMYRVGVEIDRLKGVPPKIPEFIDWDDDLELWVLRMALQLEGDEYQATYECRFKNGYELHFSNY